MPGIENRKRAPGGGIKKGEDTKLKRIPVALEMAIDGLIELYKYYKEKEGDIFETQIEVAQRCESIGIPASVLLAYQLISGVMSAHSEEMP